MGAHRRTAFDAEANAFAWRACFDMAGNNVCPRITAGAFATGAAHFLDGPDERGFDGAGSGVNVIAVEAESRFEAQAVARAEADRFDAGIAA